MDSTEGNSPRVTQLVLTALLFHSCGSGSCGGEPGPDWSDLTRSFEPQPLLEVAQAWAAGSEVRVRRHESTSEVWIETTLERKDWKPGAATGVFWTERPGGRAFEHASHGYPRLAAGQTTFERAAEPTSAEPGKYFLDDDSIHLALGPGEALPEAITFGLRISAGGPVGGNWRVQGHRRVGNGIPVWSGGREVVGPVDVPQNASFSVVTHWPGSLADSLAGPLEGERPRFRVAMDGEVLLDTGLEVESEADLHERESFHRITLPPRARSGAEFVFTCDGPPGLGLFFLPAIGPAQVGSYHERPWGADRPDVVLFLADTLRADMLSAYGGDPELMPNVNALATDSVRFLGARATASWTLPSISSLLTGVYPGQHAATDEELALAPDLDTLAELFRERGYRTGAITDAAFFSHTYGLDQGFDWFNESSFPDWDTTRTIDEALDFLDRDDGRPVFLLVHSYRVHAPYRSGPDEDMTGWDQLQERGHARVLEDGVKRGAKERAMLFFAEEFRSLYLQGVRDLDAEFGRFAQDLRTRRILDDGYVLFTSDHGEAFGENGSIMHGKDLWDVKLRVPLLLAGKGLQPGDVSASVSMVDIAPTLGELAGIRKLPAWSGASLTGVVEDRPSFSFLLESKRKQVTVVEGDRKVFALPTAEELRQRSAQRAFELDRDPGEDDNVAGAAWVGDFCLRHADELERVLEALVDPRGVGERPDLGDIGYGDD